MYIQIQVACGSRSEAESIGSRLVEKRLVACAQISAQITSVYRWEGRIQSSEEWMCSMKTTEALYDLVESEVRTLHSYDTPEIIASPIINGSRKYLNWISEVTIDA